MILAFQRELFTHDPGGARRVVVRGNNLQSFAIAVPQFFGGTELNTPLCLQNVL